MPDTQGTTQATTGGEGQTQSTETQAAPQFTQQDADAAMSEGTSQASWNPHEPIQTDTRTQAQIDFEKDVPDDIRQAKWFENIAKHENPKLQMAKEHANLQKLLGQRTTQIPNEQTPPEQRKAFYQQLGVPDTIEGYDIQPTKFAAEDAELGKLIHETRNDAVIQEVLAQAQAEGVPKAAMQKLVQTFENAVLKHQKAELQTQMAARAAQQAASKADNAAYEDLMRREYGDNVTAVESTGKALLNQYISPEKRQKLLALPNESVVILADVLYNIGTKTLSEDKFSHMKNAGAMASNVNDIRRQGEKMMMDPRYTNPNDAEHASYKKMVDEHFAQISKMGLK